MNRFAKYFSVVKAENDSFESGFEKWFCGTEVISYVAGLCILESF